MTCPKCGSANVNIQVVNETKLIDKHHGCIWWLIIGWWWIPIKWLYLTIPALIVKIFIPKRQKVKTTQHRVCVCQNCGNSWNV